MTMREKRRKFERALVRTILIMSCFLTSLCQAQPEPQSPGYTSAPGERVTQLRPTFTWKKVTGATKYGLYISKYPYGSSNIVYENENISGSLTSFTIDKNLEYGHLYRWNMRAYVNGKWTSYSSRLYFYIPPAKPEPTSPGSSSPDGPNTDTLTPTFKWNSASGASYYAFYIKDTISGELVFDSENFNGSKIKIRETSYTLPSGVLKWGRKYRWNMRAWMEEGGYELASDFSGLLYFQTPPPPRPDLTPYKPSGWSDKIVVSKTTGTTTDDTNLTENDTLYVDWAVINQGDADITTTFYVDLYVDGVFKQRFSIASLRKNSPTSYSDYSIGKLSVGTHTIKIVVDATNVIAEKDENNNEYTKTITVSSAPSGQPPSKPSNPSPADGATNQPTSLTLSWSSSGATKYDLYFGTNSNPPLKASNLTSNQYSVSNLSPGTTYYWKVVAKNDYGQTAGDVWRFTTATQVTGRFKIGDRVCVTYTAGSLTVRDNPAGNAIAYKKPGQEGKIVDGPRSTSDGLTWWKIEWSDGVVGWSHESGSKGIYLEALPGVGVYPSVSHGDRSWQVEVYSDAGRLNVRESPSGTIITSKSTGSRGWTLDKQPVLANGMIWWLIRWDDGTVGWSADSQLNYGVYLVRKATANFSGKMGLSRDPNQPIDFGSVAVNESKDLAIRIYNPNDGTSNRVLTGTVQVSGNGFSLQSPSTFELLPGEGRIFTIRFRPTASGNYSGTLTITHNASNYSSPLNIALKGSAGNVTTIRLSVSPSSLDFGQVEINTTQELSVTITNDSTSTGTLNVSDLQVSGSGFKLAGGQSTNFSLSPGQSKTVRVQFNPTAKTTYSGSLRIYHNATNSVPPYEVSLKGTGVEFSYRLSINVSPANSGTILVNGQEVNLLPFERSYAKGTNLTLEAKENNNYSFKNWSGSLSSTNRTISLTLNSDINLTATFVSASSGKQVLNVKVNDPALGQVSVEEPNQEWKTSISREFNTGETVTIQARVKPGVSGVKFSSWRAGGHNTPEFSTSNTLTLTMNTTYNLIAEFKDTEKPVIGELSVTPFSVLLNRYVTIRATATDNIGVKEVIATIVKPDKSSEKLTLTREDSGAYSADYNKTNIPGEYTVTVQVKDAQGNSSEKTISFNVRHESNTIKLTVKAGQGGKVQINNEEPKEQIIKEFTKGSKENIKIKALPPNGYTFVSWQVNPPNIIPDAYLSKQEVTIKTETIQTDVEIIAKFSEKLGDRGIYAPWRKGVSLTPTTYDGHHKDIKKPDGSIIHGKNRAVDFRAYEGAIVLAPHDGKLWVKKHEHTIKDPISGLDWRNVSYYEVIIRKVDLTEQKDENFYTHYVHIVPIHLSATEENPETVTVGQPIGFVSDLGWAKLPHIHFQISEDGTYNGAVDLTKQKMQGQYILKEGKYIGSTITSENPGKSENGKDYKFPIKRSIICNITTELKDNTLNIKIEIPPEIKSEIKDAKHKIIVLKWYRKELGEELEKGREESKYQIKDSIARPLANISESNEPISIDVNVIEIPKAHKNTPDKINKIKIFVLKDNQPIVIDCINQSKSTKSRQQDEQRENQENEPNNTPSVANSITQKINGVISQDGDVDYFSFEGREGEGVSIWVAADVEGSALDSVLTLYDSDGATVLATNDDDGITRDSFIRFTLPHSGTFYIKVESYDGSGSENHFYTLYLRREVANDDFGDDFETATPIERNQTIEGTIGHRGDVDVFRFNAYQDEFLTIDVRAKRNGSPLDAVLTLYREKVNENGETVREIVGGWDDVNGYDPTVRRWKIPATGIYYLVLKDFNGEGGADYRYTLNFTIEPPPMATIDTTPVTADVQMGEQKAQERKVGNIGGGSVGFASIGQQSGKSRRDLPNPFKGQRQIVFLSPRQASVEAEKATLPTRLRNSASVGQTMDRSAVSPTPKEVPTHVVGQPITMPLPLGPKAGTRSAPSRQASQPPDANAWQWIIVDPTITTVENACNIHKVWMQRKDNMLYFKVETAGRTFDPTTVSLRFNLDTDMRVETGVSLFTNMGVDYLVSIGEGTDGVWRWDSATESFNFVSDLTWQKIEGNLVEIGFPLSAINDAEEFALLVELSDDDMLEQDSAPDEGFALITKLPSWLKVEPLAGTADSGEEVPMTLTLNAEAVDQTGEISGTVQVFSTDPYKESQQIPVKVTITPPQLPFERGPGLFMVSLPISVDRQWHEILGIPEDQMKLAIYLPQENRYLLYKELAPEQRKPRPGVGVWIKLSNAVQATVTGVPPKASEPFVINLYPGWQIIGVPWQVKWANLKVRKGNEELPISQAAERGWVYEILWTWDDEVGDYQMVWAGVSGIGLEEVLRPFMGYWILALEECQLVIPPKSEANRGVTVSRKRLAENGFVFGLMADDGRSKRRVWLGFSNEALGRGRNRQGVQAAMPPEAPEPSGIQVFALGANGKPLAADIRLGMTRIEWDIVVRWDQNQGSRGLWSEGRQGGVEEVRLTWEGLGYLPKGMSAFLVDMTTGTRRYLRTQSVYQFKPQPTETERRFKVILEQGGTGLLKVLNLRATPVRGQGVLIQFALTKPATTQVEILTLTGRRVAVVESGQNRSAGQQSIVWRGVGVEGQKLPIGTYLIRVLASDEEGRQVQVMSTFVLR
jgi:hypothetical protein